MVRRLHASQVSPIPQPMGVSDTRFRGQEQGRFLNPLGLPHGSEGCFIRVRYLLREQ